MQLHLPLVAVLTLALGLCVAASFFVVGGPVALFGPGVIERAWPVIYPLQAVLVAVLLFVVARALRGRLAIAGLVLVIVGAWLGQWVVLASGVLDGEVNPGIATYYWVLATGGPLQPIAAAAGGVIGLRAR